MPSHINRRKVVAMLLLGAGPLPAIARASTRQVEDTSFPDTLDLPELAVSATDTGFEGLPAETAAGRYVVSFTNEASDPEGAAVHFMQLPDGVTVDSLTDASATPADGDGDGMPDWTYEVYQAGGIIASPGQTAQVVLDLTPGNYMVWGGFPDLPQAPVSLTVTGDMPADLAEPEATVVVHEVNTDEGFAFKIDGTLAAGPNVIRIENMSDQPHFLFIERYPETITLDQVMASLMFDPDAGTPPPDMIDETLLELTVSSTTQSAGTIQWLSVNLEPGSHIISCFVADPTMGGMPHAFAGVIDVIEVGS